MPRLTSPAPTLRPSFLRALEEFHSEGLHLDLSAPAIASRWAFSRWLRFLEDQATSKASEPSYVPQTTLWWVEDTEFLGRLTVRHSLNPWLLDYGGHIGYEVRPSARHQGHATHMLAASLPLAHSMGIDPALLTCDEDNTASRRVIERNGGVFEDQRGQKLRFWVPTHP